MKRERERDTFFHQHPLRLDTNWSNTWLNWGFFSGVCVWIRGMNLIDWFIPIPYVSYMSNYCILHTFGNLRGMTSKYHTWNIWPWLLIIYFIHSSAKKNIPQSQCRQRLGNLQCPYLSSGSPKRWDFVKSSSTTSVSSSPWKVARIVHGRGDLHCFGLHYE